MDVQDVYNDKKQFVGISKERNLFESDELCMSAFVWIVNEKGEMLVQKRSSNDDNKPGSYGITGGAVDKGESSLIAAVRETKEELGIDVNVDDIKYIGTERRLKKFFEYYFCEIDSSTRFNIDINEVDKIEWISLDFYAGNISNSINFQMFKNFYLNIYLKEKENSRCK